MPSESFPIALELISPERTLVCCQAASVELPGGLGRFMVLKDHAPLISSLTQGAILFRTPEGEQRLEIASGFVEVGGNRVTACVEMPFAAK